MKSKFLNKEYINQSHMHNENRLSDSVPAGRKAARIFRHIGKIILLAAVVLFLLILLVRNLSLRRNAWMTESQIDQFLETVDKQFPLTEQEVGKYNNFKVSPLNIKCRRFDAEGLGSISIMQGKAMFGIMDMKSIIINADKRDIPLFSFDYITVLGNNTLLMEYYDTMDKNTKLDFTAFEEIEKSMSKVKEYDLGTHWYDSMKLDCSIAKKDKRSAVKTMKEAFEESVNAYLDLALTTPELTDEASKDKNIRTSKYVDGLLENGGPSTDTFVKKIGKESTREFFTKVFFHTEICCLLR